MKYQRIRQQLISEIATGAFTYGDAFPSENAVANRFAVSRMTARRALGELEREGYLERIPGKGNILQKPKQGQGFFTVRPFKDYAAYIGARPSSKVLKAELTALDTEGQEKLGVERAVFIHRLRSLNDELVMDEQRYLVHEHCKNILQEDLEQESIHELLIDKYKLPLGKVWQHLYAVALSEQEAKRLECSAGSPAFLLERITYSFEQPISWVKYLMRGDKYSFENEFSPANFIMQQSQPLREEA